jgi:histidinol-phosphate aminotransferase
MKSTLEFNSVLKNLPVYLPGRPIEEVARELGMPADAIIKMASNENPLGPSPAAIAAVEKAARQMHLYPDGNVFYLKEKLAAHLHVNTANLIMGNGSNELLELVGHAMLTPGSEVVASEYCFAVYPIVAALFGAKFVSVPAKHYGNDIPAILKAITPKTKIVFVADPNNPTGTMASSQDLERLVAEVPAHVLLVIDQAYVEYQENTLDLIPQAVGGAKSNLILTRTFSKIYGLAGLRLGYGIASQELVAALEKIRQPFNVNSIAQAAGMAALEDVEHTRKVRQLNAAGLRYFEKAFADLKLEFVPSSGNFILVKVGNGMAVFTAMQREGVITRPVANYKLPEWIRISVGTEAENHRCVAALKNALGL